jgi:hypothetical protein
MKNVLKISVRKPDRMRGLLRRRHRWDDIILDLRKTGSGGVDWMHVAQNRDQWSALVSMAMNLWVP